MINKKSRFKKEVKANGAKANRKSLVREIKTVIPIQIGKTQIQKNFFGRI